MHDDAAREAGRGREPRGAADGTAWALRREEGAVRRGEGRGRRRRRVTRGKFVFRGGSAREEKMRRLFSVVRNLRKPQAQLLFFGEEESSSAKNKYIRCDFIVFHCIIDYDVIE